MLNQRKAGVLCIYFVTLRPQLDDGRNTVCPYLVCVSTTPQAVLNILNILKSTSFLDKDVFFMWSLKYPLV